MHKDRKLPNVAGDSPAKYSALVQAGSSSELRCSEQVCTYALQTTVMNSLELQSSELRRCFKLPQSGFMHRALGQVRYFCTRLSSEDDKDFQPMKIFFTELLLSVSTNNGREERTCRKIDKLGKRPDFTLNTNNF